MTLTVSVFGQGSVGRAVTRRLQACGHAVTSSDEENAHVLAATRCDVAVLALTHGREVHELLPHLTSTAQVIDLTTQSASSCLAGAALASGAGFAYSGGGVTGGALELAEGRSTLLLGPAPVGDVLRLVEDLGRLLPFDAAPAGARAKLLHNTALLLFQTTLASLARSAPDMAPSVLFDVLASGTAGRPLSEWSLVRDSRAPKATSSYKTRLVQKDLAEVRREFPYLSDPLAALLEVLENQLLDADPESPFTDALMETFLDIDTTGSAEPR